MEPGNGGGRVAVHSAVEGDRGWGGYLLVGCDRRHSRSNYMGQEISIKVYCVLMIESTLGVTECVTFHNLSNGITGKVCVYTYTYVKTEVDGIHTVKSKLQQE